MMLLLINLLMFLSFFIIEMMHIIDENFFEITQEILIEFMDQMLDKQNI